MRIEIKLINDSYNNVTIKNEFTLEIIKMILKDDPEILLKEIERMEKEVTPYLSGGYYEENKNNDNDSGNWVMI